MKVLTLEQVQLAKPSSDSRWIGVRGLLGSIVFGTIESSPSLEVQGHKVLNLLLISWVVYDIRFWKMIFYS